MPARRARSRCAVGLDVVRRLPRPHRRHARTQRGLPRRALDDAPRRHGRARRRKGAATADDLAAMERVLGAEPARRARSASRRRGRARTTTPKATWCRRATRPRTSSSRCAGSCRDHPGTTLEFIPCIGQFEDYAAGPDGAHVARGEPAAELERPVRVGQGNDAMAEHNLAGVRLRSRARRARVLALTMPDRAVAAHLLRQRLPARHDPGLAEADGAPPRREEGDARERRRPAARCARRPAAGDGSRRDRQLGHLRDQRDVRAREQAVRGPVGRATSRRSRAIDPFDALCDIVVADDLMTGFGFPTRPDDDEDWAARVKVLARRRAPSSARRDAGAHLDFLATFNYSTALLGKAVRERRLLPIEEAIHLLTDVPGAPVRADRNAAGSHEGWHADVVVIDPDDGRPAAGADALRPPDGRAAPVRRRRRHRPRARQRHRDRRPRRVHRRAARARCCARAATPRPSPRPERHRRRDGPAAARSSIGSGGGVAARRARRQLDVAPGLPERDVDARSATSITDVLGLHDTMTQRAEAAAIADAYLTLVRRRTTNVLPPARGATSGSIPTSVDEAIRRDARRATPLERRAAEHGLRDALTPPAGQLLRLFTGLDGGVKLLVDLRADVLRVARRRPGARPRSTSELYATSRHAVRRRPAHAAAHHVGRAGLAAREAHRVRSRARDRLVGRPEEPARLRPPLLRVLPSRRCRTNRSCSSRSRSRPGSRPSSRRCSTSRAPELDPEHADTAVFYSISNCQPGLAGVNLGNALIKQVVEQLTVDLPQRAAVRHAVADPRLPALARTRARGRRRLRRRARRCCRPNRRACLARLVRRGLGRATRRSSPRSWRCAPAT